MPAYFNLTTPRQLLRQGKVKPGAKMTIVYAQGTPSTETIALMLQANLNSIGLDVRLQRMTLVAAIDQATRGTYDAFLGGWYAATWDPSEIVNYWLNPKHIGTARNTARYNNPRVGELLKRSVSIFDRGERHRVVREALAIAAEDAPYAYLARRHTWMVRNTRVKGYVFDPLQIQNINYEELYKSD